MSIEQGVKTFTEWYKNIINYENKAIKKLTIIGMGYVGLPLVMVGKILIRLDLI